MSISTPGQPMSCDGSPVSQESVTRKRFVVQWRYWPSLLTSARQATPFRFMTRKRTEHESSSPSNPRQDFMPLKPDCVVTSQMLMQEVAETTRLSAGHPRSCWPGKGSPSRFRHVEGLSDVSHRASLKRGQVDDRVSKLEVRPLHSSHGTNTGPRIDLEQRQNPHHWHVIQALGRHGLPGLVPWGRGLPPGHRPQSKRKSRSSATPRFARQSGAIHPPVSFRSRRNTLHSVWIRSTVKRQRTGRQASRPGFIQLLPGNLSCMGPSTAPAL